MRVVYHTTGKGKRKFRMNRSKSARNILVRQQLDQILTHDKITTIYDRARHMRPTVERVISKAKRFIQTGNENYFRQVHSHINTRYAIDRLFLEILPRLQNKKDNFVKVAPLSRRKGDNVLTGSIQIVAGNSNPRANTETKSETQAIKAASTSSNDVKATQLLKDQNFFREKINMSLSKQKEAKSLLEKGADLPDSEKAKLTELIYKCKKEVEFFSTKLKLLKPQVKLNSALKKWNPMVFRPYI